LLPTARPSCHQLACPRRLSSASRLRMASATARADLARAMRMSVHRRMPGAPGTYGECRERGVAGSCGDRHADAWRADGTTQPADDTKRRDHCQRTEDHRSRGLADQQTGWPKLRAVGHEWDRAERGTTPVEHSRKHWIAEIVEGGIGDEQRAGEQKSGAARICRNDSTSDRNNSTDIWANSSVGSPTRRRSASSKSACAC